MPRGRPLSVLLAAIALSTPVATAQSTPESARARVSVGGEDADKTPSALNPRPGEMPPVGNAGSRGEQTRDVASLLSRVAALRARLAALSTVLLSSKLQIELQSEGDASSVAALTVTLDGGVVFRAPSRAAFEEVKTVYEHAVAPGRHVVGVEVERRAKAASQFATWQSTRFVVDVPPKGTLLTRVELEDESTMGEDFADEGDGDYELHIRMRAEVDEP